MNRSTIASGGGFPDLGLEGAVIVVTGAGSGIGAATALRLGAAGAHVVLVGRRSEPLELERARPRGSGWPGPLRRGRPVRGREPRPRRARGGRTFRDGGRLGQQRCDRSSRAAAGVEGRGLRRARSRQRQGAVLPPTRLAAVLAGIADPLGRQRELVVWDTATPRPVGLRDDEGGPELPDTIARG